MHPLWDWVQQVLKKGLEDLGQPRKAKCISTGLELLAATLAVKTFVKNLTQVSVLLRIDNTTAVAYINNMGGTVSAELVALAWSPWMWCLERNIRITAQYLPGVQNAIADAESWTTVDRFDWKLNPNLYWRIDHLFGPIDVDLFNFLASLHE